MWKRLAALPPYCGGKRRLLGQIFKHLPSPASSPVFVDAFLGGGAVSLFAKARGYRLVSNDLAIRSHIVGKALIENERVTLSKDDVIRLFAGNGDQSGFIEENFAPNVVTTKHAQFLDHAFANTRSVPGVKRWLLLLLLVKYVLRMRPMANFGARKIINQAEEGNWEEMNQHYVRDILVRGIANHPRTVAETLRKQINQGVFSNGQMNEAHQLDVFEFLEKTEGDIIYFDPPYAKTLTYETSLKALDSMLEGRIVMPEASVFSKLSATESLEMLFDASRRFPIWVLSYGNAEMDLQALTKLVGRFKIVIHAEEFRYVHLTGLSSEEHRKRNRELLIVAKGSPR